MVDEVAGHVDAGLVQQRRAENVVSGAVAAGAPAGCRRLGVGGGDDHRGRHLSFQLHQDNLPEIAGRRAIGSHGVVCLRDNAPLAGRERNLLAGYLEA